MPEHPSAIGANHYWIAGAIRRRIPAITNAAKLYCSNRNAFGQGINCKQTSREGALDPISYLIANLAFFVPVDSYRILSTAMGNLSKLVVKFGMCALPIPTADRVNHHRSTRSISKLLPLLHLSSYCEQHRRLSTSELHPPVGGALQSGAGRRRLSR
jgi:hypothetical protein